MSPSTSSDYPSSPLGNPASPGLTKASPDSGLPSSTHPHQEAAVADRYAENGMPRATQSNGFVWERWALIALLLLGGGYGLWQWFGPKPPAGAGGPGGPGGPPAAVQGPPPRPVVTTLLRAGIAGEQVQLLGQVESGDSTILSSQVSGVIEDLAVIAGDRINTGDLIATLDDVDQRLALAEAEADLSEARALFAEAQSNLAEMQQGTRSKVIEQRQAEVAAEIAAEAAARDNLNRIKGLVQEGAVADRLLVEAQAEIDEAVSDRIAAEATLADAQAGPRSDELKAEAAKVSAEQANITAQEAAVAQALLALQRTRVVATAPGIVNDMLVNVGDYVNSADPILELVDNSIVDILLELPEVRAAQIQPGQPVTLRSRALPGWQGETTIASLTPIASATSRSRAARIRLTNPPAGLLPGTALVADFSLSGSSDGYQVSRDVLTRRAGEWLVFAIEADGDGPTMVQEIAVNMVSDNGETVIIDSPELRPNLEIVLKGGDALRNEAPVMVVEGPSAGPPPDSTTRGTSTSEQRA